MLEPFILIIKLAQLKKQNVLSVHICTHDGNKQHHCIMDVKFQQNTSK